MPEFSITRQIAAPIQTVWEVLDDFGNIQEWNPGVVRSALTSEGPVGQGATRECDFQPFGGVSERIVGYRHEQRMTVEIYETSKLPIRSATADFGLAKSDAGTVLRLDYRYEPNLVGRVLGPFIDKRLRRGIGGLAKALKAEAEAMARSSREPDSSRDPSQEHP